MCLKSYDGDIGDLSLTFSITDDGLGAQVRPSPSYTV